MRLFSRKRASPAPGMPLFNTERLVLRSFDVNDAVDVYAYAQNPNVGLMAGWAPHQTPEDSRQWIQKAQLAGDTWAVVEKKTGRVIGTISLLKNRSRAVKNALELGYALSEDYWGHGYATEACREVLRYAFLELDAPVVAAGHFPQNANSKRVIKKLGFFYEGTLRAAFTLPDGTLCDVMEYSMTAQEYRLCSAKWGKEPCRP